MYQRYIIFNNRKRGNVETLVGILKEVSFVLRGGRCISEIKSLLLSRKGNCFIVDSFNHTDILTETELEKLFNDFFKALCAFAFEYVQEKESALEIVQNAYVELWSSREKLVHTGNLKAYLYTMVRNDCLSLLRKKKQQQPEYTSQFSDDYFLETNIIRWETIRILYDAIGQLSEQAQVILNYSLDGLKNQEIADLMGISLNTVHTVKKRAYKKLKKLLKDHYYVLMILLSHLD